MFDDAIGLLSVPIKALLSVPIKAKDGVNMRVSKRK
jgi:hypothetical protein